MHTAILATLERKGIITREEGEALVEFINNKPQSTMLADAIEQVSEFISKAVPKVEKALKAATGEAKKVTSEVAEKVASEAAEIDEAVHNTGKKADSTPKPPTADKKA